MHEVPRGAPTDRPLRLPTGAPQSVPVSGHVSRSTAPPPAAGSRCCGPIPSCWDWASPRQEAPATEAHLRWLLMRTIPDRKEQDMNAHVSSILLGVPDMDQSKEFYTEGLGWKVQRDYGISVRTEEAPS